MEELLNPVSDPMLIDQVVQAAFNTQGPQQKQAMAILAQFQELPDSWQKVPMILENSLSQNSKVGASKFEIFKAIIGSLHYSSSGRVSGCTPINLEYRPARPTTPCGPGYRVINTNVMTAAFFSLILLSC